MTIDWSELERQADEADRREWEAEQQRKAAAGDEYAAVRKAFDEFEAEVDAAMARFRREVRQAVLRAIAP